MYVYTFGCGNEKIYIILAIKFGGPPKISPAKLLMKPASPIRMRAVDLRAKFEN